MAASRSELRISNLGISEFINCFSLFVVVGCISTAYFFGRVYHANLSAAFYWLLGTTTWIVYTYDHILDGNKLKEGSISIRHLIHYRYRRTLLPGLAILTLFNAYLAVTVLPSNLIYAGLVVAGLVLTYFVLVHWLKSWHVIFPKELFVSIIVAIGMMVLPGISGNMLFSFDNLLMFCGMACVNFGNLLLFSWYDYENDVENGLVSAATNWGKVKTKRTIMYSLALSFTLFTTWALIAISQAKLPISISLMLMLNILVLIFMQEEWFAKRERYRFWGDFIFLIPGIVWWVLAQKPMF